MDWKMSAYHLFKSRHIAFQIAILLKGLEGCLEVLGSAILLIIRPENINTLIFYLTRGELTEDPQDFLANQLIAAGHALTWSAWFFVSLYLLFHGAAKIALVYLFGAINRGRIRLL
jgi:uncharacterized membrane protein